MGRRRQAAAKPRVAAGLADPGLVLLSDLDPLGRVTSGDRFGAQATDIS
jgi:hypothetical protein